MNQINLFNFSIIIPCYNESLSIGLLIDEILEINFSNCIFEVIIINDGSSDNSAFLLKEFAQKYKIIKIITNKKNKGQSYSIYKGISNAKYENIVTIDGDGQNDPNDINRLISLFKDSKYSLVGGIRTKRKDNYIKIFSSKIANSIRKKILNDDCDDTGCSLKIFKKNFFLKLIYFDGMHRFLPALFKSLGCYVSFKSVNHRKRNLGKSKYGTFDRLFKSTKDLFKVYKIIKNSKTND